MIMQRPGMVTSVCRGPLLDARSNDRPGLRLTLTGLDADCWRPLALVGSLFEGSVAVERSMPLEVLCAHACVGVTHSEKDLHEQEQETDRHMRPDTYKRACTYFFKCTSFAS